MSGSGCQGWLVSVTLHAMKTHARGFTLIELMLVVGIIAVMASLAAPSFRTMLVKRTVQAGALALVEDMRFARSEALRRATTVTICNLAVNSTSACIAGGTTPNWANGWLVFVDNSGSANSTVDTGEEILRVQQPLAGILTIQDFVTATSTKASFTYQANGWARSASEPIALTPTGTVPKNSTRLLCVSLQGRPSLRLEGAVGC